MAGSGQEPVEPTKAAPAPDHKQPVSNQPTSLDEVIARETGLTPEFMNRGILALVRSDWVQVQSSHVLRQLLPTELVKPISAYSSDKAPASLHVRASCIDVTSLASPALHRAPARSIPVPG